MLLHPFKESLLAAADSRIRSDDAELLDFLAKLEHARQLFRGRDGLRLRRIIVEIEQHPRLRLRVHVLERVAELLLRTRRALAAAAEAGRHDAEVDVAERRLVVDDVLRREPEARDDVVLPLEQLELTPGQIPLGFVDARDHFIEDVALRLAVAGAISRKRWSHPVIVRL